MTSLATGDALAARLAEEDGLLMPGEVAAILRVDPKTVTRWIAAGRLDRLVTDGRPAAIATPGGHRRVRSAAVRAILAGGNGE